MHGRSAKEWIDLGIQEAVDMLLSNPRKDTLYYSADKSNFTLGTGIFNVGEEVKTYITRRIHDIPQLVLARRC